MGLALLLALLQLAAGIDAATLLQMLSSDHPHALRAIVDGGHVDLVLSHDAARPVDAAEPRLHPKSAEDHVVHLAPDESADARKPVVDAPPAPSESPIAVVARFAALPGTARAPSIPVARAAAPFSRRSVVLRT